MASKTPKVKPETEPKEPKAVGEIGASGLRGAVPGQGWLYQELLPELQGRAGVKRFQQMSDNDPIASALLYAIEALVRGVEWRIEPAKDKNPKPKEPPPPPKMVQPPAPEPGPDGEQLPTPPPVMVPPPPEPPPEPTPFEEDAEAAAEFMETVLFEDLDVPFPDVVNEALTMLPYGFSLLEIVAKKRNGSSPDPMKSSKFTDGYIGLACLSPRSQDTVHRWQFDASGRATAVEQLLVDGRGVVTIPLSKLLHFKTTTRLSNPEGRSILRGAYVSWMRKQTIEEAEGRVAVRAGGVVEIRIPGELLDPNAPPELVIAKNNFQIAADRLAADRQGSILMPSDTDANGRPMYELKFAIPETRRNSDMSTMVERYNKLIAMTVMADFLLIGHESVGSFALADSKTTMFARTAGAVLDIIATQFNRVLIPKIWAWNGFDEELRPSLVHGDLEKQDLTGLAGYVSALAAAGMPIFPDEATENYLREQAGLPPKSEEAGGGAMATPDMLPGMKQLPPGSKPVDGAPPSEEDDQISDVDAKPKEEPKSEAPKGKATITIEAK